MIHKPEELSQPKIGDQAERVAAARRRARAAERAKEFSREHELERYKHALRRLTDAVEDVFDRDWEHTQGCFKNIEQWVGEDETFLQTSNSLSDEGNNWGNRASFLRAHYEARALLNEEMRLGAPFDL